MSSTECSVPQPFPWPTCKRGAISLTFDDGRTSQLDAGIPLFNALGVRATFYILPSSIDEQQEKWRLVAANGHELGSHTMTHPCSGNFSFARHSPLESMTLEQMEKELIESRERIEKLTGKRPLSFAYPCGQKFVGRGEKLQSYVPLVARHYLTGRGWRDEYFNSPDECDLAQLGGMSMDGMSFDEILPKLQETARSGTWLILAGHDIGPLAGRQTTALATLDAICTYCKDQANGLWLDTVGVIGSYIQKSRHA